MRRLWLLSLPVYDAVFLACALAAVFAGWRPAAFVIVAAFTMLLAVHLLVGAVAYRRVMNRPWPRVRPLDDDDEW